MTRSISLICGDPRTLYIMVYLKYVGIQLCALVIHQRDLKSRLVTPQSILHKNDLCMVWKYIPTDHDRPY